MMVMVNVTRIVQWKTSFKKMLSLMSIPLVINGTNAINAIIAINVLMDNGTNAINAIRHSWNHLMFKETRSYYSLFVCIESD